MVLAVITEYFIAWKDVNGNGNFRVSESVWSSIPRYAEYEYATGRRLDYGNIDI
jgi:hypothetical protein